VGTCAWNEMGTCPGEFFGTCAWNEMGTCPGEFFGTCAWEGMGICAREGEGTCPGGFFRMGLGWRGWGFVTCTRDGLAEAI
jgi:hypothetical protein